MDLNLDCSDQVNSTNNSNPGSPRRRKTPLDIDAALYLQSQAKNVQEPAGNSKQQLIGSDHSINSSSNNNNNNCSKFVNNLTTKTSTSLSSGGGGGSGGKQAGLAAARRPYIEHYTNYVNQQSNISVDYIDCLSNNDLDAAASNADQYASYYDLNNHWQPGNARGANMRNNIPTGGRKHNRFYRNRIEPAKEDLNSINMGAGFSSGVCYPISPCGTTATATTTTATATASARVAPEPERTILNSSTSDESASFGGQSMLSTVGQQQQQQQQQLDNSRSAILFPISVSEVKKRTYFIGSVGQDSLLGEEELYRYFPNGRVRIFACTWNQNRKRAPMNLNDLLLPDQLVYMPDIYAIGIQEAFSSQQDYLKDWEIELQTTLGANHVLLHSCSLGVLHLALFVRRDLIWFCSTPEESTYNSRSMPTNMIKTKGAVSIAFRFFGTSFMFTNCHFPAHENRLRDRIDEYRRIINSIDLPKNLKLLKPRYLSNDSTARFDCCFFMGDLNFRLEQRTFDETINILEDIFQQKEPTYEALIQNDELLKVMETDQAFHGFDESQIRFPPTYKFLAQTNKYDQQTKRVPSYTDRILFRSKRQRHIQCLNYDWLPQLISSDHKPVYCLFDVLVRPGYERNLVGSLNAGLFQRAIYLEALKRRAEDPDGMGENGASGNLICSIT